MSDNDGMTFTVDAEEREVVRKWHEEEQRKALAERRARSPTEALGYGGDDQVYYGPIGGGLSYCFYGTSLGTILVVKDDHLGVELKVTEAMGWKNFG